MATPFTYKRRRPEDELLNQPVIGNDLPNADGSGGYIGAGPGTFTPNAMGGGMGGEGDDPTAAPATHPLLEELRRRRAQQPIDDAGAQPQPNEVTERARQPQPINTLAEFEGAYGEPPPMAKTTAPEARTAVEYKGGRPVSATGGSEVENQQALYDATGNYMPQKQSGWRRWVGGFVRNAMRGGRGTGGDPLAALGGGLFGVAEAGLNPSAGDEQWKDQQKARVGGDLDTAMQRERYDTTTDAAKLENEARRKKLKETPQKEYRLVERDGGVYLVNPADPKDVVKLDQIPSEAKAGATTRYFEIPGKGVFGVNDQHPDGFQLKDIPAGVASGAGLKIPESYYRGKNKDKIKATASAEVQSKPQYYGARYIRPEILKAYGSEKAVYEAMSIDPALARQAFIDPATGLSFERDLSATQSRLQGDAEEYDRVLDMTSKDPSAQLRTVAEFEQAYEGFRKLYDQAAPKDRDKLRQQFERDIRQIRVVQ